jgi:ABC-2 type transport system ATP-binding protein
MSHDKAIVISTHILEEVEAVCSRAVIIARGKIRADARPDELRAQATNHNAVLIVTTDADAAPIKSKIGAITGVTNIDVEQKSDSIVHLRVFPKKGQQIAQQINDLLRAEDLSTSEVFIEQGALDDVFWDMTAEEKQGGAGNA